MDITEIADSAELSEKWKNELTVYLEQKSKNTNLDDARTQVQSALNWYTSQLNKIGRRIFINNIPGQFKHAIRFLIPRSILRARRLREHPRNAFAEYPLSIDSLPHKDDPISLNEAKADFAEILSSIQKFGPMFVSR